MLDCATLREYVPITGKERALARINEREREERRHRGRSYAEMNPRKGAFKPRHVIVLSREGRGRVHGRVAVKTRKSRSTTTATTWTTTGARGNCLTNLRNMAGLSQSWGFIGLIVTRAKRRRRARLRAHENFCPVKIFSPEGDGTEPRAKRIPNTRKKGGEGGREEKRKVKETNCPASETETSTLRSKRRKLDGRREKERQREKEFTEARFMDYRSGVRDLSRKPVLAELSRGKGGGRGYLPSNETAHTRKHVRMRGKNVHDDFVRRKREERRRRSYIMAEPCSDIQRAATRSRRDPIRASVNQKSRVDLCARGSANGVT